MRSRKGLFLTTAFLVTALAAATADAAPPAKGDAGPPSSSSQFTLRREEAGGPDATVARTRARAGDCAGALPAFDNAIRSTIEPTLRRDRGLCHEKLGDPFPAIDDYRAYLVARPDAPDADQIRDRLSRLEEQVGVGAPSAASYQERDESLHDGSSFSLATDGSASASTRTSSRRRRAEEPHDSNGKSYEDYAAQERLADVADSSPLRYGTGLVFGGFLMMPRYFVGGTTTSTDLAYAVGASLRYAWSSSMTFIGEVGYGGIGTAGEQSSYGGPLLFVGIEGRIPLDTWASNQLLLGIGPGFERYTVSATKVSTNIFEARARFGYRHVFGPSIGIEIVADGGPIYGKAQGEDGKTAGTIAGMFALTVGF